MSPCKWRPEVGTRLLWPRLKAPNASVCHFCRHWPKILVTVCPIFSPPPSPFPTSRPDCSIQSGGHLSQLKRPLLTLRQELLAPIFQHSSTSGGIFHAPHFTYCMLASLFSNSPPNLSTKPPPSTCLQTYLMLCVPSESEILNMVTGVHCCLLSSNIMCLKMPNLAATY